MESLGVIESRASGGQLSGAVVSWLVGLAAAATMVALFADVLVDLAAEWWTHEEASYGMLVPVLALYVAYLERHRVQSMAIERSSRGLLLVAFGCLIFLSGKLAGEFFLARMSFVIVLAGMTWTLWGTRRFRALAFPLILLATMIPLPVIVYNAVAAPLQLLASRLATEMAQMLGVSIYRDGNIIHLATTMLGVEEACSGLHSLPALVVGSLLLGYITSASMIGRILLVAISIPLAIAVNILRVMGTALLADYRPEFAEGFYHSFSGWLVFVLGFAGLWLIAQLLFRWTRKSA
jgi:exosortase